MKGSRFALLVGISAAALFASQASAQNATAPANGGPPPTQPEIPSPVPGTAGEPAGPSAASEGGIDEIIITANKRVENVQDVPKSVQVVSSAALQRQNITDIADLQKLVPTIAGTGQTLAIRGVGTGASTIGAQSKVGVVLDDVPQASRSTIANNLIDIERVEVLPGPQGTLAGRNATGGLVNLVTRGPTSEWTGFVNLLATSDFERQAAVFVAGPITDKVQISVSNYYRGFRGLVKNIGLDQFNNDYTLGNRTKVKLLLSEDLTVTGTFFYQYSHRNGVGGGSGTPLGGNTPIFASVPPNLFFGNDVRRRPIDQIRPGVTTNLRNNEYNSPINGTAHTSSVGGIGRVEYGLPNDSTITSITSFLDERSPTRADFFGWQIPLIDLSLRPEWDGYGTYYNSTRLFTQELRINSSASGRFHYVAGVFFSNQKQEYDYQRWFQPVDWLRNFYSKTYAAYAHADYDLTDQLKVQGGVRFEKDEVDYRWVFRPILATSKAVTNLAYNPALPISATNQPTTIVNFPTINQGIVTTNDDKADFVNFDAGAQYKITPTIMAYGTYAQAQQGPIFDSEDNITGISGPLQTLPQEKVKSIELGLKTQLFDRRLTFNISVFQARYQNYQVQTSVQSDDPNVPPTLRVAAVGRVRTRGVEANIAAQPVDHLRADFNFAYTEAKILAFPNAPCYTGAVVGSAQCFTVNAGTPRAFNTQGDLTGELLNRAPRIRLTASIDYGIPLGDSDYELYITPLLKYATKQRNDLLRLPTSYIGSTTIVDLNAGIRGNGMTLEFFVRNLTREQAQTYTVNNAGYSPNVGFLNRVFDRNNTRYVGVRGRYNF